MTELKLNERLRQILTPDELLNVDAYWSFRDGLCIDVYLGEFDSFHNRRLIHNLKAVAMGHAKIRTIFINPMRTEASYGYVESEGNVA